MPLKYHLTERRKHESKISRRSFLGKSAIALGTDAVSNFKDMSSAVAAKRLPC
jgi:hypothetical protein